MNPLLILCMLCMKSQFGVQSKGPADLAPIPPSRWTAAPKQFCLNMLSGGSLVAQQ